MSGCIDSDQFTSVCYGNLPVDLDSFFAIVLIYLEASISWLPIENPLNEHEKTIVRSLDVAFGRGSDAEITDWRGNDCICLDRGVSMTNLIGRKGGLYSP